MGDNRINVLWKAHFIDRNVNSIPVKKVEKTVKNYYIEESYVLQSNVEFPFSGSFFRR